MSDTATDFTDAIDQHHDARQSVVLRYRNVVRLESEDADDARLDSLLERTSIREGLRIVPLFSHRGVDVDVLDETSLMHTGTLKSIDGCVTTAKCLLAGYDRCVFESGGNTGTALAEYGHRAGLETYLFVPTDNLPLLDSRTFARERTHLIAVDDAASVKAAAGAFAERHGMARVPKPEWRFQASTFIGCFLLEQLLGGARYDVLVQTISAAFAPIGIYRVLAGHVGQLGELPALVGIQQEGNCPMYRAWHGQTDHGTEGATTSKVPQSTSDLLATVMYDRRPQTYGTFDELAAILKRHGGDVDVVGHAQFFDRLARPSEGRTLLEHLAAAGIDIATRDGDVIEKVGMLALVGALARIERGLVPRGSRVLVCLTGGSARPDGLAVPERRIRDASAVEEIDAVPVARGGDADVDPSFTGKVGVGRRG
jgi:threonine synthase